MNVLMLYPRYPAEMIWNSRRSIDRFTRYRGGLPPLGLLTIASYLPDDFKIRLVDRNIEDESEDDWAWADVVFLSVMLGQRVDYEACVAAAKARGKPIAVGGPFTHAMPEVVTAQADWVCFAEAEDIIDELVADLRAGRRGQRYEGGNKTDLTRARIPRFDLLADVNAYGMFPLQFSRGCPFKCEFCDIIEIYGRVPRTKTAPQFLAELSALKAHGYRGTVFVVDDNFIGNKKHAKVLLKELAVWNDHHGYPFRYLTEASLNVADDEDLLRGLAAANFFAVFIGIETPQPDLLRTTQKLQNANGDMLAKLHRIRQHGLHVLAGIVLGFDGERADIFEVQRAFFDAAGLGSAMPSLLVALPNTQLQRRLQREGRLLPDVSIGGMGQADASRFAPYGINFIPNGELTKREYLRNYGTLLRDLYRPDAHLRRIVPALLDLRYTGPRRGLFAAWRRDLGVFWREIVHFGLRARGSRFAFWHAFLLVLWRNPLAMEALGWELFYCYYLNEHARFVEGAYAAYADAPASDDVLDERLGPGVEAVRAG